MWCQSAGTADSDPCPRSCGVDELSRPTRSRIRADTGSTSNPGPFGPWYEPLRSRSPVPGYSDPGSRSCDVDQLSRHTLSRVRAVAGVTSYTGRLGPKSEELWGRPAIPANSVPVRADSLQFSCPGRLVPGSSCRGVGELYLLTRTLVRGAVGSTSYPGQLRPGSELTWG